MDPFTLVAVGVCAAWLVRPQSISPGAAALVGGLAALGPDSDVWILVSEGPASYMLARGSTTHAVWMIPVWSALAAGIVRWRSGLDFIDLWRCGLVATASHLVIESVTLQGVAPLAPLSDTYRGLALVHTIDLVVVLCVSLPFWLPTLRRRSYRVRGLFGLLGYVAVVAVGLGSHLSAETRGRALADAMGLSPQAQIHVWPRPWMTTGRNIFVVDAGLAYHASYDLFAPPSEFHQILALNSSDPVVQAMNVSPHVDRIKAQGGVLQADIKTTSDARVFHVLVNDLRYFSARSGNYAPGLYALTRRTSDGGKVIKGRWVWGDRKITQLPDSGDSPP